MEGMLLQESHLRAARWGEQPPSRGTGSPRNCPPAEVEKQSVSKLLLCPKIVSPFEGSPSGAFPPEVGLAHSSAPGVNTALTSPGRFLFVFLEKEQLQAGFG